MQVTKFAEFQPACTGSVPEEHAPLQPQHKRQKLDQTDAASDAPSRPATSAAQLPPANTASSPQALATPATAGL